MTLPPSPQQTAAQLIQRHDPDIEHVIIDNLVLTPFTRERQVISQNWADATPDEQTKQDMTAVLDLFLTRLAATDHTTLAGANDEALEFLDDAPTESVWHLRKNTLMAAYSALRASGLWYGQPPVRGVHLRTGSFQAAAPAAEATHKKTPRNRVATSDEVLLARVCARLDTSGPLHRRAAALAIATSGAATGEGAAVCWHHHNPSATPDTGTLHLPGRHLHDSSHGWHSAPRTLTLTPWAGRALSDWRSETTAGGRPLQTDWSVIYTGYRALDSQSAKNSYDHHINLTLDVADLSWIPGLTSLALAEWAAAHAVLHFGSAHGAHVMGVDVLNVLRRLTKADTRAYRAVA